MHDKKYYNRDTIKNFFYDYQCHDHFEPHRFKHLEKNEENNFGKFCKCGNWNDGVMHEIKHIFTCYKSWTPTQYEFTFASKIISNPSNPRDANKNKCVVMYYSKRLYLDNCCNYANKDEHAKPDKIFKQCFDVIVDDTTLNIIKDIIKDINNFSSPELENLKICPKMYMENLKIIFCDKEITLSNLFSLAKTQEFMRLSHESYDDIKERTNCEYSFH